MDFVGSGDDVQTNHGVSFSTYVICSLTFIGWIKCYTILGPTTPSPEPEESQINGTFRTFRSRGSPRAPVVGLT